MADADVQITAGSGTKIDTRTVGAGTDEHRQVVCVGDPDVAAQVAQVVNQALRVLGTRDVRRISVQSAGLTTATTAYTAGDQVGTLFTLADAARATGGTGSITGIALIDAADVISAYDVVIFRDSVTLAADNAAFAISDDDALNVVAVIPLAGGFDIGNNRVAQAFNLAIPYDCAGTSLFAALMARVGHGIFGAVGNLRLIVHVERN